MKRPPRNAELHLHLLARLSQSLGKPVSASELIFAMWAERGFAEPAESENYMRKQVTRLRRAGHQIETLRAVGYRLVREAS